MDTRLLFGSALCLVCTVAAVACDSNQGARSVAQESGSTSYEYRDVRQDISKIPVGDHFDLGPLRIPGGHLDSHSEFQFMVLDSSGYPTWEAWYAYPTTSTVWSIDGIEMDAETMGARIGDAPPDLVDVAVHEPGVIARLNIQIAEESK
ncbi:MAG: hypothetical protein RBS17_11825 [Coriobacteriia bacterium]|nr:hypothetical protein [Coriobacteriia bacterium]